MGLRWDRRNIWDRVSEGGELDGADGTEGERRRDKTDDATGGRREGGPAGRLIGYQPI